MTNSVHVVKNIARIYENRLLKNEHQKPSKSSSGKKYIDEVDISIEGKKKQILENIVLEAIDELPTKTFEK